MPTGTMDQSLPRADARAIDLALFAAAIGAAIFYLSAWPWHPYPGSPLLKAAPMLLLTVLAVRRWRGRDRIVLTLAMLAAACGDALLDVDRVGFLRPALFCFLVTQVCYSALFIARAGRSRKADTLSGVLVLVAAGVAVLAWPTLDASRIPVLIYLGALLTMAISALHVTGRPLLALGAVLFFASDLTIGIDRFIQPFAGSTPLIVALYVTGQLLIGWALLFDTRTRTAELR